MQFGSSPRTWGTPLITDDYGELTRFIPTYMGNARPSPQSAWSPSVHPHVHGERNKYLPRRRCRDGSSPRTWGTLGIDTSYYFPLRFIPTYMGNATIGNIAWMIYSVHPHVHGERHKTYMFNQHYLGSSPRTWGTPPQYHRNRPQFRFIPTYMGNAWDYISTPAKQPVHPHVHGERINRLLIPQSIVGSSPRTWGTQHPDCDSQPACRFIPTYMGNALCAHAE